MVVEIVVVAVWAMLPAYIPNNVAVVAGGGTPIDHGRTLADGERILGDGKTWRGTAVGTVAGILLALVLNQVQGGVTWMIGVEVPTFPLHAAFALASGAMFGDILASFGKRRTGRERGASFPVVDQLDFVIVALLLTAVVATSWFLATFTVPVIVAVIVLTPLLHVGTNAIAYVFGLKDEPW